jgi:hypothetical protein
MENDILTTEFGLIFLTECMGIYVCVIFLKCRPDYYESKVFWNSSALSVRCRTFSI